MPNARAKFFIHSSLHREVWANFSQVPNFIKLYKKNPRAPERLLWVCSPQLGVDAHKVFSQAIAKTPPASIRFVFPLNDLTVKRGEVNPYEVQFLKERFKDESVKSNDQTSSNIYIFDDFAFITSAVLTAGAFESNLEVGVMIDGAEVDGVKAFFEQHLWQNAKPVGDLKKQKSSGT